MSDLLLEARNLSRDFPAGHHKLVHAVSDVSVQIAEGETLGIVGESGCGKSTLGRMLIRMIPPTSGDVFFLGKAFSGMNEAEFRPIRRQLQMIFQDPYASLNPRMSVRDIIAEPLETWKICGSREKTTERVLELMQDVGLNEEFLHRYPHQFSGGQRQRIGIARAIAADPSLIVCDEPTSALDVSVQNQILNLLGRLQRARGLSYLFISHNISVVRHVSDRIAVMFLGKICETGPTEAVFNAPQHPYTKFLLAAVPKPDPRERSETAPLLQGEPPSPMDPPSGCRFRTRCPYATERCAAEEPRLQKTAAGTEAACHMIPIC